MDVRTTQSARHSGAPSRNRETNEKVTKAALDPTALPSLSHAELKSQWTDAFGTVPPKGLSRRLMVHALAYELQAQQMGRLRPSVRQELRRITAPEASQSSLSSASSLRLTPGTRLMREWRGTVHVVDVTEDGLVWNGRAYSSLSAIARTITGTRWSGQRFFGLRKRSDAAATLRSAQSRYASRDGPQAADTKDFKEVAEPGLRLHLEPAPNL